MRGKKNMLKLLQSGDTDLKGNERLGKDVDRGGGIQYLYFPTYNIVCTF